jgi:signal transduction histidine kinase
MGAGAGREGRRHALPPRQAAERSGRRSMKAIFEEAAARLDALGDESGGEGEPVAGHGPRDATQLLRELQRDLSEADATLEALAREIRIALTVIKGRAQLLRRQAFATGAPDRRLVRSVEEIDRAVVQIDRLLRDRLPAPPDGGDSPARPAADS